MGIKVFAPYADGTAKSCSFESGTPFAPSFKVKAFALTDNEGKFVHTNGNGTECPCYGFLIEHEELGRMLYITDCELIKFKFKNIDYILLGVNYSEDSIEDLDAKTRHVITGHLSLQTAVEFVKSTSERSNLKGVIMCHLSDFNAEPEHFINEMQKAVNSTVLVAKKGMSIELRADGCPF